MRSNQTEKEIEKAILQWLEHLPECFAFKVNTVGIFDPARKTFRKSRNKYAINGVSDIVGLYRGRMICIEVKRPQNKERPEHQRKFIENINNSGGLAFFASSLEEVKDKFKELN